MARRMCILSLIIFLNHAQLSFGAFGDFVRLRHFGIFSFQSLAVHEGTGAIFIVENDNSREASTVPAMIAESASRNSSRRAVARQNKTDRNYSLVAKVCECACSQIPFQDAYCPSDKDTCGLSADGTISCFSNTRPSSILRSCWPIVMLWYAVVILFLFFTEQGRNSQRYILACFHNNRVNDELVYRTLDRHRRLRRRASTRIGRRSRSRDEFNHYDVPALDDTPIDEDDARRPQRLTLKTKRFCRPCGTGDDESEGHNCSICFVSLADGDRVGALECQHSFHVDCLKRWIRRKNSCPLCQKPNVATRKANCDVTQPYPSERREQPRYNLDVAWDYDGGRNVGGSVVGREILTRIRR